MTPEQIIAKYHEAVVGTRWMERTAWQHFRAAMSCSSPHRTWRFEYVDELTVRDVPRFVLQNRCRM
eukprot:1688951-Prymnesium_polylepis.1